MKVSKTDTDFQTFFQAYLEAALWSSTISEPGYDDDGEGDTAEPGERDGDNFDKHFSTSDFDPEFLEVLEAHCLSFWSRIACFVPHETGRPNGRETGPSQAGHDFWLTQNGHGAGFWDGDWPVYGEMFTKVAKGYPEMHLFITESEMVGAE